MYYTGLEKMMSGEKTNSIQLGDVLQLYNIVQ